MSVRTTYHGSKSETRRAKAVARLYTEAGVPRGKIGVVDTLRDPERQYTATAGEYTHVSVWERPADTSDDLTQREFSAFMRVSNRLVNGHPENYYANDEETRCVVQHEYIDAEIMSQTTNRPSESGDDDAEQSDDRFAVHHNGGNRFTVHDTEGGKTYRVNLDATNEADTVSVVGDGEQSVPDGDSEFIIGAAVQAGPEYRPGPQEQLHVTVEAPAGNGGNTASSGGSDENSTSPSDVDVVTPPGDHDYDADELTEAVDQWLSNYTNVKTDLVDGWWDLSLQTLTNPQNGSSHLGVHIELEPFGHSCWSGDSWAGDDSKEKWTDHQKAMRSIFSDEDSPVEAFSVETDDEYDDWYNYVPADDAADLGE